MRPVFHYAGYTVSAAPVGISKDVLLQPYTSAQSNGAMTFISSGPFLGSAVKDSTYYLVGAYLPVPVKNNIYREGKTTGITVGHVVDDYKAQLLVGSWQGTVIAEAVTVSFSDDGTGQWQQLAFAYELNQPQSGDVVITFDDGSQRVYTIVGVTEQSLQLYDKSQKLFLTFTRHE